MERIDDHQDRLEISFDSAESAIMSSKLEASIFLFCVRNLGTERTKIFVSNAVYTTALGEEIDQDVWLDRLGYGPEGFSLAPNTFKKIGCVFYKHKLPILLEGDKISLAGHIAGGLNIYNFTFQCSTASTAIYELFSSSVEPSPEVKLKLPVTDLVERLELLEEKVGVRFEGVYAVCEKRVLRTSTNYSVVVNFDVVAADSALAVSFYVCLNAYNSDGQLLSTEKQILLKNSFLGIQSCTLQLVSDQVPSCLRLFPSVL